MVRRSHCWARRPVRARFVAAVIAIVGLAPACLFPATARALGEEPAHSGAVIRLLDRLAGLQAYRGHFEQWVRGANGQVIDQSRGEVAFERPGLLRWHTLEPFEQLLVADGESVWFYDPDLLQATRRTLGADLAQLPGLLLTGRADALTSRFEVTEAAQDDPGQTTFVLEPRTSEGSALVRASLRFEGDMLTALQLLDAIGNLTLVHLSGESVDALPTRLFEFQPPDGVEVVDARTP